MSPGRSGFHPEVLDEATLAALQALGEPASERGFYLAGGTALSLQLGHRGSIDLDWFREAGIPDALLLAQELREAGVALEVGETQRDTLHASVNGVRASFISYRYPLLEPVVPAPELCCSLASLADLAAMKLAAVSQRGLKRDFHDVAALGRAGLDLPVMLALYRRKYGVREIVHVLAGLTFFQDAERDESPVLRAGERWEDVKDTLREWVRTYAGR